MTDKQTQAAAAGTNMEKDPADWVTGDEPMTGAQHSYLKTLCEEAGADFDATLTKAQASLRIDDLQRETGRGQSGHAASGGQAPAEPSVAGEEDPGASEDDPEMRRAMLGESRAVAAHRDPEGTSKE